MTAVAVSLCSHTGLLVAQNWATFHSVFRSLCSQARLLAPEDVLKLIALSVFVQLGSYLH